MGTTTLNKKPCQLLLANALTVTLLSSVDDQPNKMVPVLRNSNGCAGMSHVAGRYQDFGVLKDSSETRNRPLGLDALFPQFLVRGNHAHRNPIVLIHPNRPISLLRWTDQPICLGNPTRNVRSPSDHIPRLFARLGICQHRPSCGVDRRNRTSFFRQIPGMCKSHFRRPIPVGILARYYLKRQMRLAQVDF